MNLMVPMVDSHAHLSEIYRAYDEENKSTFLEEKYVPKNAAGLKTITKFPCGLSKIITVEDDPSRWGEWKHEGDSMVSVIIGCHPLKAHMWDDHHPKQLEDILKNRRNIRGVGATGFDTTQNVSINLQENIFRQLMRFSLDFGQPLVLHFRGEGMFEKGFDILYRSGFPRDHGIVVHSFSGTWQEARPYLQYFTNLYMGVSPMILHSKKLEAMVWSIPPQRLLLETDAPNFPHKERKMGMPADLVQVGVKVALIKCLPPEEIFSLTAANAERVFSFSLGDSGEWRKDNLNFGSSGPFQLRRNKEQKIGMLQALGYCRADAVLALIKCDDDLEKAKNILISEHEEVTANEQYKASRSEFRGMEPLNVDYTQSPAIPPRNTDGRGVKRPGGPTAAGDDKNQLGYSALFKRFFHDNFMCIVCKDVDKQHEILFHCSNGHLMCMICHRVAGDETTCGSCGEKVTEAGRCRTTETAIRIFRQPELYDLAERYQKLEAENKDLINAVKSLQSEGRITTLSDANRRQEDRIKELEVNLAAKEASYDDMSFNCANAETRERSVRQQAAFLQKQVDDLKARCDKAEKLKNIAEARAYSAEALASRTEDQKRLQGERATISETLTTKAEEKTREAEEKTREAEARAQRAEEKAREAEARAQRDAEKAREAEARAQEAEEKARGAEARAVEAESNAMEGRLLLDEVANIAKNRKCELGEE